MPNRLPGEGEELALLRSIDATLKELLALSKSKRGVAPAPASNIADDADLDSEYGDEPVKFKPRDWTGAFVKGQRMSECSPEFLEMLAESFAYFARKNDDAGEKTDSGKPKSFYDRRSERRARGWAARKRAGWKPPAVEEKAWAVGEEGPQW